jgi:hypothetical protein
MTNRKQAITIRQLDERRFALSVDHLIRYVGSLEECERRAAILTPKDDREFQDRGLLRACRHL